MSLTILPEGVLEYADAHSTSLSSLCLQIRDEACREHGDLALGIVGHTESLLLGLMIRLGGYRSILEIGTFVGFSAIAMAEYADDKATLYTCENNPAFYQAARSNIAKFNGGCSIRLVESDVFDFLNSTAELMFDFVFVDGNKREYEAYLSAVLPRLETHGMICIDNSLRSGRVLDPLAPEDLAVARMNRFLASQETLIKVVLPLRDGLTIVQKRRK